MQNAISPSMALDLLKEGNKRFVNNLKVNRNLLQQANETSDGQHPFAVILSCIDSRTSAELIFDQGLGDVFSVRIAGNIINEDILGSMEFGCKVAGSKIIVVLGHTKTSPKPWSNISSAEVRLSMQLSITAWHFAFLWLMSSF